MLAGNAEIITNTLNFLRRISIPSIYIAEVIFAWETKHPPNLVILHISFKEFNMRNIGVLLFILFQFVSCSYSQNEYNKTDSNDQPTSDLKDSQKSNHPAITREVINGLVLYKPVNLAIDFMRRRPDKFDSSVFLAIPAAFTTTNTTIDGFYIENGVIINFQQNDSIQGGLGLWKDSCHYYKFNTANYDSISKEILKTNGSFFQQQLLISQKQIIPCNLLVCKRLVQRRAICKIGNEIFIAESVINLNLTDFSQRLLKIGVENAIYTDMGGWSEGWYRSDENKILTIGNNKTQTKKQTNWFIFKTSKKGK